MHVYSNIHNICIQNHDLEHLSSHYLATSTMVLTEPKMHTHQPKDNVGINNSLSNLLYIISIRSSHCNSLNVVSAHLAVPPVITTSPESYTGIVGEQAVLRCRVRGFHVPDILWLKDREAVNSSTIGITHHTLLALSITSN